MAIARQFGDATGIGRALHLAVGAAFVARPAEALHIYEEAFSVHIEQLDRSWQVMALTMLGLTALRLGDRERAVASLEDAIALGIAGRKDWELAIALDARANLGKAPSDPAHAGDLDLQSLELAHGLGDAIIANEVLAGLAGVLAASDRLEAAARLFGAAEALRETAGLSLNHLLLPEHYERDVELTRQALGAEAFVVTWTQSQLIPPSDLVGKLGVENRRATAIATHLELI